MSTFVKHLVRVHCHHCLMEKQSLQFFAERVRKRPKTIDERDQSLLRIKQLERKKDTTIQIASTIYLAHRNTSHTARTVKDTQEIIKKWNSRQHVATSLLRDSPFTSNMMGQTKYVISHSRASSRWSPVPPSKL